MKERPTAASPPARAGKVLDTETLAFYGWNGGGILGPLMLAVEPRLKVAVLYVAGFAVTGALPEVDPFHYTPRVSIPVLMINSRYDNVVPVETAQLPMYRLLGTPPEHKRHVLYDGGHYVPRAGLIRETLDWLDRYLGPVQ